MIRSLSARLLVLTVLFVMFAEVLILVMAVPQFRQEWVAERLWDAQIASLSLEASSGGRLNPALEAELLRNAMAVGVELRRVDGRVLTMGRFDPSRAHDVYDLQHDPAWRKTADAWRTLLFGSQGLVVLSGAPHMDGGRSIALLMDEEPLRHALVMHAGYLLLVSLVISLITAALIYVSLFQLFVRPMKDIAANMERFAAAPDDPRRVFPESDRRDEIGTLQRVLRDLEDQVRIALAQRAGLASLGEAVAKVNHDLRNILATARLVSNRLSESDDPGVRTISTTLIRAIDRAIGICSDTLRFGRPREMRPRVIPFELRPVVEEAGQGLGLSDETSPMFLNHVDPGFEVEADPEHLFRALQNLFRNAVEAIGGNFGEIVVSARDNGSESVIEVADTGPGLPEHARENLFKPFKGTTHERGAGLGLVNVREILQAHGGEVRLVKSDPGGTVFRLHLPKSAASLRHAAG
ncbi:MAG: sensor histidine kinase [Alphaproteobacteria bacterium]|nr:sensor histidine kinase [Alphaproteobacteria bacterium]